ncbi:hypothetical protein GH714_016619 [Hevea brasiliensis]|uniref:Uncharacterized protein n=1 Tax=Hevea brasiliensis TaxID=3981 RepID=A0A6A6LSU5_HEVBR|nr:hypothetical protein GH714_016619 [Hevea brasiliensis]
MTYEFQSHSAKSRKDTKDMLMVSTGQHALEDMLVETAGFEKVVAYGTLLDNVSVDKGEKGFSNYQIHEESSDNGPLELWC